MTASGWIEVRTPDLGSAEPVQVSAWLVNVGETVLEGDRLVELLLPGVTYDVPSPVTGRLVEAAVPLNASVVAGDLLARIDTNEETG